MQLHSPGTRGVPGLAVHNIQKYPSPRTAGYLYHIVPGLWVVPGLAATDPWTVTNFICLDNHGFMRMKDIMTLERI